MLWFQRSTAKRRKTAADSLKRKCCLRFEPLESRRLLSAMPIYVTTLLDPGPVGTVSLRQAISLANMPANLNSTIYLQNGTYKIQIPGAGEDLNATGDFDILQSVTIQGSKNTVINGMGLDRVFDIPSTAPAGTHVTFNNLTITGGLANGDGGGIHFDAPANTNVLTLYNSTVTGNNASGNGGGVYMYDGTLSVQKSSVDKNTAGEDGGGIYVDEGIGALTISCGTVNGNLASGDGGGIESYSTGAFSLLNSQLNSNHSGGTLASGGGGEVSSDLVTITGSTVSNNTTGTEGGGLAVDYSDDAVGTLRSPRAPSATTAPALAMAAVSTPEAPT